jgi:exonuclease SbcC
MDRQHVLQFAENSLGHIETVTDGLYKGQINIIDKAAGTFFIDFNENINLDTFSSYQENLLSDEYYSLAKEQQWSLYLFMLRDHVDNRFKSEVEKNDRYARKYVFRENEFVDFFTVVRQQDGVRTTLIESWKHSLEEAGLSGVYGDGAIKGIVSSLDAVSERPGSTRRIKAASPVEKISYIRRIKLNDNFRAYPVSPRIFDFKRVNLVKGINGAGKTSLFEAIEIALCGATFRNNTFPEKNGCVEAMYNYSTQLEVCKPSNSELYRSRDLNWYNVPPGYTNQLHYSFNRFNFFNADAAHRFSSGSADEEIRKALVNIILGPEYEHILNRTEKLIKEVRPAFNKLEVERNIWVAKQKEAELYIKDYKEDRSLAALGNKIDEAVKGLRPVQEIVSVTADAVVVEQFVKVIRLLVEGLIKEGLTSSELVDERIRAQAGLEKKMADFRLAMDGFQTEIKLIQDNLKQLQQNKNLLEQAQVYFSNSILFGLEGLQQRARATDASVNRLVQLQNSLSDILLEKLKSESFATEAIEERTLNIADLRREQQVVEDKVRIEMERLGKIQGMLQQIKSLGKAYLDSDEAFQNCPLCETEFVREELLLIVQRSQDLNADGEANLKRDERTDKTNDHNNSNQRT